MPNSIYSEKCLAAYQVKGKQECSNKAANILPADPLSHDHRGWGQRVIIQLFQNIVMLHIKLNGITKCSNMVAYILPADTSLHDPRSQNANIQFILNNVMLHIKLKGIANAAHW